MSWLPFKHKFNDITKYHAKTFVKTNFTMLIKQRSFN